MNNMSLQFELRALCHQLSSTPNAQLPYLTPILLRNLSLYRSLLSEELNTSKTHTSENFTLVHKLKAQLSTLLYGKSVEGRLCAVVLIKAIIEVGGLEILKYSASWVKGLLSILEKPSGPIMTRLCILSLTTIYLMSYEHQTLIREITTPTLPTFVSSCLNLVLSKSSGRVLDGSIPLTGPILDAFSVLIPQYPTIFRPFSSQLRLITRPYLAPTICDRRYVPSSLSKSARRTTALIHYTAGKNSSGEEWGNSVRELVKEIHGTSDKVCRSVIENWESICGYSSQPADMKREPHGGGNSDDDLPEWSGIDAGLGRLIGLLGQLEEFLRNQTASSVQIPLGPISDVLARLMSVIPPKSSAKDSEYEEARFRPAIGRDERDGLWMGLPSVHIAAMQVYTALADRLEGQFASLAELCLDQAIWVFPSGQQNDVFRATLFNLMAKLLRLCGLDLPKKAMDSITPIIIACCKEFRFLKGGVSTHSLSMESVRQRSNGIHSNADGMVANANAHSVPINDISYVLKSATELLPLFLSHLSQEHLEAYLRAEIDRTAIIYHHNEAMTASVLNPYVRKDGRCLPSILPHFCRQFPNEAAIETLLRPRFPVILQGTPSLHDNERIPEEHKEIEDDVMIDFTPEIAKIAKTDEPSATCKDSPSYSTSALNESVKETLRENRTYVADALEQQNIENSSIRGHNFSPPQPAGPIERVTIQNTSVLEEDDSDSSGDSVHLTMAMSDSEDESIT